MIDLGKYNTYTGKNTPPTRQGNIRGPQYQGQQLADQRNKDKEELYRKNWEQFKADSNITPEFILADSASKDIANKIDSFDTKWGDAMKSAPNNELSHEEQLQMRSEKKRIEMEQQKAVADMQKYQLMKAAVEKNPMQYDDATFRKWEENYLTTGKFDYTAPPLAPINMTSYIATEADKAFKGEVNYKNGRARLNPDVPEDAKKIDEFLKTITLINPRAVETAKREWDTLGIEGQRPFLEDINNDKVKDEKDIDNNAILRYIIAKPEYRDQVVGFKENRPRVTSATTNKGVPVSWGGKDVVIPVGQKRTEVITYGGITRPNLYSFGGTFTLTDIPTDEAHLLYDTTRDSTPLGGGNIASAKLKDYDADRDLLIVQMTTGDPTLGIERVQLVEVPARKIPDVNNLPIIVNGKQTNLGTLRGASQSVTTNQEVDIGLE